MPVRIWMVLIIVAGLSHWALPEGRWVLIHLFTLGVVANSILVWGQHFAARLLGSATEQRDVPPSLVVLSAVLNVGIVFVIGGRMSGWWPVTTCGAVLVGAAILWRGVSLLALLRANPNAPKRKRATVCFLSASALMLPVGAVFGAILDAPIFDAQHDDLLLAHEAINLLGFVGLAAAGVLSIMFPAVWRAREERPGRPITGWVLALMLSGIALAVLGSVLAAFTLSGLRVLASLGLLAVAVGWSLLVWRWAGVVRAVAADPRDRITYAALSVAAAPVWLICTLLYASVQALSPSFVMTSLSIPLLVGFAAQLLLGMMSWLMPSTIGGGGPAVRAGIQSMDRAGVFRWTVLNLGTLLWMMPLASWARVLTSASVALALVSFLPLMVVATKRQARVRRGQEKGPEKQDLHRSGQATAAVAVMGLVTVVGMALTDANVGLPGMGSSGVSTQVGSAAQATGTTVEVDVTAQDMRFDPAEVTAQPGDRLVIHLHNTDDQVHDLRLASGESSGRVAPGDTADLVLESVPEGGIDGWCSIAGHSQQGMTFRVDAESSEGATSGHDMEGMTGMSTDAPTMVPTPDADSPTVNPLLEPASSETVHKIALRASEFQAEVSPGVEQEVWSFGDDPISPTLRGKIGDRFEITFINDGTMTHSLDFHAGIVSPDEAMKQVPPGDIHIYTFTAVRAGIWMYHCSTMPMSTHIAAGMTGAVIIDPPDLPAVDHEVVLVETEGYWNEDPDGHGPDSAKIMADEPDAYRFNGYAAQYLAHPIEVKTGETVRFWVLAAGPNHGTSFHVVGTQFNRVWKEGSLLLDGPESGGSGGSQALDLSAAQGGYVEATFHEAGTYTFVDHQMTHAEMGARGSVHVTD